MTLVKTPTRYIKIEPGVSSEPSQAEKDQLDAALVDNQADLVDFLSLIRVRIMNGQTEIAYEKTSGGYTKYILKYQ